MSHFRASQQQLAYANSAPIHTPRMGQQPCTTEMSRTDRGAVAAGQSKTAAAAENILRDGGNAYDAAVAALLASCVAEPVLTSLGGGGFLVARRNSGETLAYDFFAQTPGRRIPATDADFYPVYANFGTTTQRFHIGVGAMAVPGMVRGIFRIHRDLCTRPLAVLAQPAIELARGGFRLTVLQEYLFTVVEPILRATPAAWALYRSRRDPDRLIGRGELFRQTALADTLDALLREGDKLFYQGELAQQLVRDTREQGGHLRARDLKGYRVAKRRPLRLRYRDTEILTNPPPSCGGTLLAFAMKLLESQEINETRFGSPDYVAALARTMALTDKARRTSAIGQADDPHVARRLLATAALKPYLEQLTGHPVCNRGTTHISIIDGQGNMASLTTSNGEGCGYVIPGSGIMMNNMLGEEDIAPQGLGHWPTDRRMTSMMAPTLAITADGRDIALGSGGSNRIRSAILQTLLNLIDFKQPVKSAVSRPRLHYEDGLLSLEAGISKPTRERLVAEFPNQHAWANKNLFFGGVHAVQFERPTRTYSGAGDPRRGGVFRVA